jgi:beta-lactamase class A
MRRIATWLGILVLTLGTAPLVGQEGLEDDVRRKFEIELARINDSFEGVFGAQFVDLATGATISLNADQVTPTASAIKVAILVELFRQADRKPGLLTEQRPFRADQATARGGMARLIGAGSSLAIEDIAKLMINLSENSATNILIDEVGMQNVNDLIATLGLRSMKLQRKMLDRDRQARGEDNISSAADAATLMTKIARCDLPISRASCDRVREILEISQPSHPGKDPIPSDIPIAFKWGGNTGVSTAWAIVDLPGRPYVFAIMTSFGIDNEPAVRAASAAAFGYFSQLAGANPYGGRVTPPRNPRPGPGS